MEKNSKSLWTHAGVIIGMLIIIASIIYSNAKRNENPSNASPATTTEQN